MCNHILSCIFVAVLLFTCQGLGALSEAEVEELKKLVTSSAHTSEESHDLRIKIERALKFALEQKAYSVLEAGLHRPDRAMLTNVGIALLKAPPASRKPILFSALLDPKIWPDPEEVRRFDTGASHAVYAQDQDIFCQLISKDFGIKLPFNDNYWWSHAERIALAKQLREIDPSLPPVESFTPPATAPPPPGPAGKETRPSAQGATTPAASPEKSDNQPTEAQAPARNRYLWLIVGLLPLLMAIFYLKKNRMVH